MIFTKFLVSILITSFIGLSTACQSNSSPKNYPKHKTAKHHSKGKKTHKKEPQLNEQPQPKPQPSVSPSGDQVNLEWVNKYDELLNKHGNKLNPPKKPGDRAGITVQGKYDTISPKVKQDFEKLEQLDHKQ